MLKALHKNDTQISPFVASKDWNLTNVTNEDLILMEHSGSDGGPVAIEYIGHTLSGSFIDSACAVAKENQDKDRINPQVGKDVTGLFFPDLDPTNQDGTFQRMVFTQVKNMFYNNYRDPTKMWGMEQIDFDKSQTKKFLAEEFVLLSIPQGTFGEKVLPNTVVLYDFNQDNNYLITDDGFNNLFAGPNIFSHQQEIGEFTNSFTTGSTDFCLAYLSVVPYGPISASVISSSAFVSWSYTDTIQDGFYVVKYVDGSSSSSVVSTTPSESRAFTDTDVSIPHTYSYQVQAFNSEGVGSVSNFATIIFEAPETHSFTCVTSPYPPQLFTESLQTDLDYDLSIVFNGGFETGDFSGWTVVDSSGGTTVNGDFPHSGLFECQGSAFATLGHVSQILPTGAGKTYILSFWLSAAAGGDIFTVSWEGGSIANLNSFNSASYIQFSYPVTASADTSELKFNMRNDADFWYLDDISVIEV